MTSQRPLWVAFLNIKGAYDNVNQEKLWNQLKGYGLEGTTVKFLEWVYTENRGDYNMGSRNYKTSSNKKISQTGLAIVSPALYDIPQ